MNFPILETMAKASYGNSLLNSEHFSTINFQPIDLNDERNLLELEDPILTNHMLESRKTLEDYKKMYESKEIVKTKEEIDNELLDNSRLSASCMLSINENNATLFNSLENIILQNTNLLKLNNGETPHGFPQVEDYTKINALQFKKIVDHLNKRITDPLNTIIKSNENLIKLERNMKKIITSYEILIGKLFNFNQLILEKNDKLITQLAKLDMAAADVNASTDADANADVDADMAAADINASTDV